MVSSVSSFDAGAYISQLQNGKPLTSIAPAAPVKPEPKAEKTSAATPASTQTSNTTGTSAVGLSSEILSLIQSVDNSSSGSVYNLLGNSNGSSSAAGLYGLLDSSSGSSSNFNNVYNLLGGSTSDSSDINSLIGSTTTPSTTSANDALSGLYNVLLDSASQSAPVAQALASLQQQQAQAAASDNGSQESNLKAYSQGFSAYNKVLQQNAQTAVEASKAPIVG